MLGEGDMGSVEVSQQDSCQTLSPLEVLSNVRDEVCPLDNVSDRTALACLHFPPAYKLPLSLRLGRRGSAVQLMAELNICESTDKPRLCVCVCLVCLCVCYQMSLLVLLDTVL